MKPALCDAHNNNSYRNQQRLDECFSEKMIEEAKANCAQNQIYDCIVYHYIDAEKIQKDLDRLTNERKFDNNGNAAYKECIHIDPKVLVVFS